MIFTNKGYLRKTSTIYSTTSALNLSISSITDIPEGTSIVYTAEIEGKNYILTSTPREIKVTVGWVEVKLQAELTACGRLTPTLKSMVLIYRNAGHTTDCIETTSGGGIFDMSFDPGTTLSLWAKCSDEVLAFGELSVKGDDLWNYYTLQKNASNVVSLYINGEKKWQGASTNTGPIMLGQNGGCRLSDMQFTYGLVSLDEIKQHFRVKLPYYDPSLLENLASTVTITPEGMWLEGDGSAIEFIPKDGIARFTNIDIESNYEAGISGYRLGKNGNAEFNNVSFRGNLAAGSSIGGTKIYPYHVGQTIGGIVITEEMIGTVINSTEIGDNPQLTDTTYEFETDANGDIVSVDGTTIINTQLSEETVQTLIFNYLTSKGFTVNLEDATIVADNLIIKNGDFSGAIDAGPLFLSRSVPVEESRIWPATTTIKNLIKEIRTDYGVVYGGDIQGVFDKSDGYSFDRIVIECLENIQLAEGESRGLLTYGNPGSGAPSWYDSNDPGMQKLKVEYNTGGSVSSYYKYIQKQYSVYRMYHTYSLKLYKDDALIIEIKDEGSYIDHIIEKFGVQITENDLKKIEYQTTTTSDVADATSVLTAAFAIETQEDAYTFRLKNIPNSLDTSEYVEGLVYKDTETGALYVKL